MVEWCAKLKCALVQNVSSKVVIIIKKKSESVKSP